MRFRLEQKKRHSWTAGVAGLRRPATSIGDSHAFCTQYKVGSDIFQSTLKSKLWQRASQLTTNKLFIFGRQFFFFDQWFLQHLCFMMTFTLFHEFAGRQFWSESSRHVHLVMSYLASRFWFTNRSGCVFCLAQMGGRWCVGESNHAAGHLRQSFGPPGWSFESFPL